MLMSQFAVCLMVSAVSGNVLLKFFSLRVHVALLCRVSRSASCDIESRIAEWRGRKTAAGEPDEAECCPKELAALVEHAATG
jgi:hypothetical protein